MEKLKGWTIFILGISLVVTAMAKLSTDDKQLEVTERFGMKSFKQLGTIMKKDQFPDAIAAFSEVGELAKADFSGPPVEVIQTVGDAIMPIIAVGLSLIPGVGPIIAGFATAVWGIVSSLFGGEKEDPMKKIIEDIHYEIKNIKKAVNEMNTQIRKDMRKEMDAKLSIFVNKAVHGELSRNNHVCGKYALASKIFTDNLRANKTPTEGERVALIALIEDCDNFLKDTVEAFVYPEYADVLWIPSVITTIMRISFLTEVANYGYTLKIDAAEISLFWLELKSETKRHFSYYSAGVQRRLDKSNNEPEVDLSQYEIEGCRMQRQLFFLDREMYPHGVPKNFETSSDNRILNLADYNVTESNQPQHIQIMDGGKGFIGAKFLNCFWGPGTVDAMVLDYATKMSLRVRFILNKTYVIRIAYFVVEKEIGKWRSGSPSQYFNNNTAWNVYKLREYFRKTKAYIKPKKPSVFRGSAGITVTATEESKNSLKITLKKGKPSKASVQRFVTKVNSHHVLCNRENKVCSSKPTLYLGRGYSGDFVLENVAAFDVRSQDELEGNILIESDSHPLEHIVFYKTYAIIMGAEIIALPLKDVDVNEL